MNQLIMPAFAVRLALVSLISTSLASAAEPFSEADKAFFAKVSQGGMYEVKLAELAETKGTTQDIRDQANTEAHDHLLVGSKLKSIIEHGDLKFPTVLNAEFKARLGKMSSTPRADFDAAYVADMQKIHAADGAAFKQESTEGTNPDLKAFAAETYRIVQRHLGELGASVQ